MTSRCRLGAAACLLAAVTSLTVGVHSQDTAAADFPTRPITLVIPFGAGGASDLIARTFIGSAPEILGQPIVIQLRPGGKLTAGGVTFLDTDITRAIEEVLPARFGGGPLDYQLVEDEAPDGRPLVRLLMHPGLGPADPRAVAEAFLIAIASGSDAQRLMVMQWRQAGLPVVERQVPHVTGAVKVLHLHRHVPRSRNEPQPSRG